MIISLSASALCLAVNLYHEARGTDNSELYAISNVVMNRVKSPKFPNDICSVIKQPYQFSWTNGLSNPIKEPKPMNLLDRKAWEDIVTFSKWFLDSYHRGGTLDETNGALYYATNKIKPYWSKRLTKSMVGDYHTYYREPGKTECIIGKDFRRIQELLKDYQGKTAAIENCSYQIAFN